jgi:hypothetical protein
MSKKLIIKINPDGSVNAETKGIKGEKCLDYIEIVKKLVNGEVYDSHFTEEYYEKNEQYNIETEEIKNKKITEKL